MRIIGWTNAVTPTGSGPARGSVRGLVGGVSMGLLPNRLAGSGSLGYTAPSMQGVKPYQYKFTSDYPYNTLYGMMTKWAGVGWTAQRRSEFFAVNPGAALGTQSGNPLTLNGNVVQPFDLVNIPASWPDPTDVGLIARTDYATAKTACTAGGGTWDDSTKTCKAAGPNPNQNGSCPNGQIQDDNGICRDCDWFSSNTVYNPSTKDCDCITNYAWTVATVQERTAQFCLPASCPKGSYPVDSVSDPGNFQCKKPPFLLPSSNKCPNGTKLVNGQCVESAVSTASMAGGGLLVAGLLTLAGLAYVAIGGKMP